MFRQPDLSQSKQPQAHYDYDGLSGGWLWFPWWVHLCVALLAWPISWWILPILPFQNQAISEFLSNYRMQIASAISILTIITAALSYIKAEKIRKRDADKLRARSKSAKSAQAKNTKKKTVVKDNKENVESKPKKTRKATKVVDEKVKSTAVKKKRAPKKKNDKQQQLDFSE